MNIKILNETVPSKESELIDKLERFLWTNDMEISVDGCGGLRIRIGDKNYNIYEIDTNMNQCSFPREIEYPLVRIDE